MSSSDASAEKTPSANAPLSDAQYWTRLLACPLTKTPLRARADGKALISDAAGLAFPLIDGSPVMLPEKAEKISGA